jgi:hypothetical protein
MKIRVFKTLLNSVYKVTVRTEDWSQDDLALMAQYGEPEINVGGDFSADGAGDDPADEFTLADTYARVYSDSHRLMESFDLRDTANAKNRALAWSTATVTKLTDAATALRAKAEVFVAEEVTNSSANDSFTTEEVTNV